MIQSLNNILTALCTQNITLINILLIPASIIESFLFLKLTLIIFDLKITNTKKIIYILCTAIMGILNLFFIPAPYNFIINYTVIVFLIKHFLNLTLLKSIISLIVTLFIFVILNILIQNPFITLFNITFDDYMNIPIYRISYLLITYSILYLICILLKNFKNIKFNLDVFDNLDKKTLRILYANLFIGFLTLCIHLVITAFYIDIVPVIITILSFILLASYLLLSVYSFTRMIKLSITTKELQMAEEYNKSLKILYDKVNGFKHDFDNIMSTIGGYIDTNDMSNLKLYFSEIRKDSKITTDLSILNPRNINNPGIYSLLYNKYFKAYNLGINMTIEFFLDLSTLKINTYKLSRILGILLDNAIEASSTCDEKVIRIVFRRENKNNRSLVKIENTYANKSVNTEEIFNKGVSGKEKHSGIGLWEVRNYIKKSNNLNLFTTKNNKFFIQQLEIYDEIRSVV